MDISYRLIPGMALATAILLAATGFSPAAAAQSQALSSPPGVLWSKAFDSGYYDYGSSVRETSDGGFIVTGGTSPASRGDRNACLLKTDGNGGLQWQKTFGGDGFDYGYAVIEPVGGGYLIAGTTESYGNGSGDLYLVKTDQSGNRLWEKTYGGPGYDEGRALVQTPDGGYLIAGLTRSYGNGSSDIYLVKTDANGDFDWERTYGGPFNDTAISVERTRDGGYLLAGGYGTGADSREAYLLKVDGRGYWQWDRKFEAYPDSIASSTVQTRDRGYIVTGYVNTAPDTCQVCLMKVSGDGQITWEKTYGNFATQKGYKVWQLADGGYLIAGMAGVAPNSAPGVSYQGLLLKTNDSGNLEWQQTYGGDRDVFVRTGVMTKDGGIVLVGSEGDQGNVETWDIYLTMLGGPL